MQFKLSEINEGSRTRQNYADMQALKDSLVEFGQLQPILIDETGLLVAGGRRYRAMTELGWDYCEVHVRASRDAADHYGAELEENLQRAEMTWQEKCLSINRIYLAKQRQRVEANEIKYTLRQAGEIFKMSYTWLGGCIRLAELIEAGDEEIIKCESAQDGIKLLAARAGEAARAVALTMQKAEMKLRQTDTAKTIGLPSKPLDESAPADVDMDLGFVDLTQPDVEAPSSFSDLLGTPAPRAPLAPVDTSHYAILGDSVYDLMPKMPDGSFHHIITDIPYGEEMDNLNTNKRLDVTKDEHDVEENVSLMQPFLQQAYRVIRDKGFCIFFYDLKHHEKLQQWGLEAGFGMQDWPIIWEKTTPSQNNAAQVNWTKNYETIMVMRKGVCTLNKVQSTSVIRGGLTTEERKKFYHPFTKPYNVVKQLLDAHTTPGQRILDPFAGEFSIVCHALQHHLNAVGIEKMPVHYEKGILHVADTIRTHHI